ncbi:MAG: PLDc N-terminal domain-containing protein [Nigerium sp.]|nr:PLDc N-terminal domain-containing protein [Nigerium sp.]
MSFWQLIWDAIWWFLTAFIFIAYLMALFSIITDLFRDRKLGGAAKAVWFIFLIFLPFLTALIYLIVRGGGMGQRQAEQVAEARAATDQYIREVAAPSSATDEIAQAKQLLDSGAINAAEFQSLKQAALARTR